MTAPFPTLQRLSQRRSDPAAPQCDLCGATVAEAHDHLVDPSRGTLVCSCLACSLLFPARPGVRFKRVPRDVVELPGFDETGALWAGLSVPIGLAFFHWKSSEGRMVAVYPSPGGPLFAAVDDQAWHRIVDQTPALGRMEPDVQALLVHRIGDSRDAFIVPIDLCHELVGRLRLRWRGISGGEETRSEITAFFKVLRERVGTHG